MAVHFGFQILLWYWVGSRITEDDILQERCAIPSSTFEVSLFFEPREQQFFLQRLVFLLLDSAALRFPIPVTTRLLDKSLIPCTNHLENGTIAFALFS